MTTQIKIVGSNAIDEFMEETYNLKVEWQANFSEIHFTLSEKASENQLAVQAQASHVFGESLKLDLQDMISSLYKESQKYPMN